MNDIEALARTVYGENRGGGGVGMSSVANVICNRVAIAKAYVANFDRPHPLFGDGTFQDCCTRPYQFSCWNKNDPNYQLISTMTDDDPMLDLPSHIATQAVSGTLVDITNGATYYYSKTMRTPPSWARGKTPCATVANQIFFKNI